MSVAQATYDKNATHDMPAIDPITAPSARCHGATPDYWEYCKATYTAEYNGEWDTQYILRFVDIPECYV